MLLGPVHEHRFPLSLAALPTTLVGLLPRPHLQTGSPLTWGDPVVHSPERRTPLETLGFLRRTSVHPHWPKRPPSHHFEKGKGTVDRKLVSHSHDGVRV